MSLRTRCRWHSIAASPPGPGLHSHSSVTSTPSRTKSAIRRIEAGSLTETEIERLGITLMRQAQEIDRLRRAFNLADEDLNIDLGPLGRLL